MEQQSISTVNKRFVWGMILAGVLVVPFLLGIMNSFRGISAQKATGLGAVAGGLAETFVTIGMLTAILLPIVAIVMLSRSFSKVSGLRKFLSIMAIGWCSLLLVLFGVNIWMFFVFIPRTTGH